MISIDHATNGFVITQHLEDGATCQTVVEQNEMDQSDDKLAVSLAWYLWDVLGLFGSKHNEYRRIAGLSVQNEKEIETIKKNINLEWLHENGYSIIKDA